MTHDLPERPEAYYLLAYAHVLNGQLNEAKALLEDVPRSVRRFIPARLLKAQLALGPEFGVVEATERAANELLEDSQRLSEWERSWLKALKESRSGNWEAAARAYDEILSCAEEPFVGAALWAQLERGIARLELEDYRGAIDDFYRSWGSWPELLEPALFLAKAYYLGGDPEGAEYVFNELYDGIPEAERKATATWIAAVYGQLKNRVKELEWAQHVDGTLRSRLRGWPLLWGGRYEEAADRFRDALKRQPDDANVLCGLGFSLGFATEGRRGSRRDAQVVELREIAEKLVELVTSRAEGKPDLSLSAHVCYILTLALRQQGDLEGARAAVHRFRSNGEHHPLVDVAYAGVLNDQGEFEAAEEALQSALDPSVVANCILGKALEGQRRYEDARNAYIRVIGQVRWHGVGYSLLAGVLLAEGKAQGAIQACRMAIERFPKNTSAHETLALALLDLRRPEEALEATRVGIECVPDRPGLHVARGQILTSLGRIQEAATSLCEALALQPNCEIAQDTLRQLAETRVKTLPPDEREKTSEMLQQKLGRTDCAEVRAILDLFDTTR